MKFPALPSLTLIAVVALCGCDKSKQETAKRLAALEEQNRIALAHQRELEQQLAEQQLVAERDAIERERQRIEDERFALEQARSEDAAAAQAALAEREQALAKREGRLESLEGSLAEKQQDLEQRDLQVSGRELELAGREPMPDFDQAAVNVLPVADYGMFYDSLASYGSWFSTPTYGYVWQPAVIRNPGWRPYWDGRWVCSNSGWTWMSDEPFGWACYHYGRWTLLRDHGWVWIPGDQWAPAWVCWRESGSYIGWAPMPPETMGWRDCTWDNTIETRCGIGSGWFTFIATSSFCNPVRRHCLPITQNPVFYGQTTNVTLVRCRGNQVFVGGPRYDSVCRAVGRPVPYYQLRLDHQQRPGRDLMALRPRLENNQLFVAAPTVDVGWNASLRPTRVRGELAAVEVDRPAPVAAEVATQFRRQREQARVQAELEINRLGGRDHFQQRRAEELAANRGPTAEPANPATASRRPRPDANETLPNPVAVQPAVQPTRPVQPATGPGLPAEGNPPVGESGRPPRPVAGQPVAPKAPAAPNQRQQEIASQAQEQARQRQMDEARQQQAAELSQRQARDAETQRQAALETARQRQLEAAQQQQAQTRQRQMDEARQQQETELAQRQARDADAQRQAALETARQQQAQTRQRQMEEARQQQLAELNQRQARDADAQRQAALETARQRQLEAARQQQEQAGQQQMEEARQRQLEAARQQQEQARQQQMEEARQQQEQLRQRQMDEARQQQLEQARQQQEQARQQQQEEARQRQQEEARQRQQEEARQRQQEEARQRSQQDEARQRQADEARQRQADEARQRQQDEARQRGR